MMSWLVGKLLMAMIGLGVVSVIVWSPSGKLGDWPVAGVVLLVTWLPLQLGYSGHIPFGNSQQLRR